jgi:large subunit ribosomal protein L4
MPAVDIYNLSNAKVGSMELSDEVFGVANRPYLLTEIVNWQRASRRAGTQCAKTKAEVNGTTKKPFPQKGRGMARQGSLRNPHQIGGGVAFAPKPRDYSYQMPKAKKRIALAVALSLRLRENSLKVVDAFEPNGAKTKAAATALNLLQSVNALVVDTSNEGLKRSMRNLPGSRYLAVEGLNVYDLLKYPNLVMTQSAVNAVQARLLGQE